MWFHICQDLVKFLVQPHKYGVLWRWHFHNSCVLKCEGPDHLIYGVRKGNQNKITMHRKASCKISNTKLVTISLYSYSYRMHKSSLIFHLQEYFSLFHWVKFLIATTIKRIPMTTYIKKLQKCIVKTENETFLLK